MVGKGYKRLGLVDEYVSLMLFSSYHDIEAGKNIFRIKMKSLGFELQITCFARQQLRHFTNTVTHI